MPTVTAEHEHAAALASGLSFAAGKPSHHYYWEAHSCTEAGTAGDEADGKEMHSDLGSLRS